MVNIPKPHLLIILILILSAPLFFYKLGQSSLISWDEAWYAGISRNILTRGDPFSLWWNGMAISDKPPGGFWLEAISFKILGFSEFAARFPQALTGLLSLLLIYLIAEKLFSKIIGLAASIALLSSFWFLYRARSGNLDTMLTFSYLLTFYLAILSRNKKSLLPFSLSFGFLSIIKGIIFLGALLPSLIVIFWGKNYTFKSFLLPILTVAGFFGTWILVQYINSPDLAFYHFSHSLRDSSFQSNILNNIQLFKEYLHSGIGRWFWPGVLGIVLSLALRNRWLLSLALFCLFYGAQFLFSAKIEIWHLIPLYPFMIISFLGSVYTLLSKIFKKQLLVVILIFLFTLYISLPQILRMWNDFINIPAFISDEAILSKEAGKHHEPFFIYDAFEPTAAFYSGKEVKWKNEFDMPKVFKLQTPVLVISKQALLDKLNLDPKNYQVLKTDRDKILILYQNSN